MDSEQAYKLELIINGAKDNWDELTEWEQGFLVSIEERYKEYGQRTLISPKQWTFLDKIYDKVAL